MKQVTVKQLTAMSMLAATLLMPAAGAQAQTVLTTSMFVPKTHPMMIGVGKWCDEVAVATEKRVTCNILPKPVASPAAAFDAVRDGLADLATGIHGYTPGRYILTSIAEFPFLGDSAESTSVAYQRVFERYLAKFDEHKGLKVITVFTHGPGDIYLSKRAINSVADLDGLKFRVGGGMVNDVAKAIGANVLLKPATESYELLSSGVVDGVFFPAESVVVHRLENFVKYRTRVPGGLYNTSFAMVMNPATWARIAPADQAAITQLSGEHAARLIGREWDTADRRGQATMDKLGINSAPSPKSFVDEAKRRTQPLERKWIESAQQRGLANASQVLQEFRAEIAKAQP